ncbi:MAG: hypothetical protein Q7S92_04010 [Candidatus Diapherotrites archaeon]|nr:hypothetical protein [Candidatus Diapherotrites archaeon]
MIFKTIVRKCLNALDRLKEWSNETKYKEPRKKVENSENKQERRIFSLWDFVDFQNDTQADHLVKVVGFEEFVDMDEIRRRIREVLQIEYKNERSLYPYIKTLADTGFLETSNVGGRRKWRKRELMFEIVTKKEATQTKETQIEKTMEEPHKMLELRWLEQRQNKTKKIEI